jgi:6-phosphogluconolactonase (cycloisomerase 2 family)
LPTGFQTPNFLALAVTPTTFPGIGVNGIQNSVCSVPGINPPTSEYLYVADSVNNVVWEYQVNTSTGVLMNPPNHSLVPSFPTGATPSGVTVDPCDRFAYVSDMTSNQISAYTICNGLPTQSSSTCLATPDDSLVPVSGSPFSINSGNGPGPLVVDPFGNFVYVVDTLSSQISTFKISPVSGSVISTGLTTTGIQPISIAVRADGNWLFVTNFQAATMSQYSITPSSGALTAMPAIGTDNYPWGVAVK